tara:strand:+ start:196 stop:792 length:597 start_codon:yes stop_codon:yes gene_type:complete
VITFNNLSSEAPYLILKEKYDQALFADQKIIEAMSISSFSSDLSEVNARFVNLKFVNNKEFIFFSNYNSPKSKEFKSHAQITALIFWNSINVQIRMKALVVKTSKAFNQEYFKGRDKTKNALAISSNQSVQIESYEDVIKNYNDSLKSANLENCPDYWGGYSFTPFYFEFWEGHKSRLNKRDVYQFENKVWKHYFLQP